MQPISNNLKKSQDDDIDDNGDEKTAVSGKSCLSLLLFNTYFESGSYRLRLRNAHVLHMIL